MEWNENTEKWVQALESGEYDQTYSSLVGPAMCDSEGGPADELNTGYCCLGVAAKVFGWLDRDEVYVWQSTNTGVGRMTPPPEDEDMQWLESSTGASLPDPHQKFLGMTDDEQNKLIKMNDTERSTFKEIAAALRECQQNPNALL